jgi:hypothetical protein
MTVVALDSAMLLGGRIIFGAGSVFSFLIARAMK